MDHVLKSFARVGLVAVTAGALAGLGLVGTGASASTAGQVTEFSNGITAQPKKLAAGADGNVWFTEWVGSKIGRITPQGVVTEFSSGITGSSTSSIAAGPDGNMWFTENGPSKIGRITP